ncbi:hypothetical protein FHQ21_05015 [Testudinibacter aquarius]|uniref:Mammalian defensins domain-containing protein n=1 Tax=Testudinibacter aquarius TaxID=1524974 RepID=A0ABY2XVA1_9PAST|nr:hypothetical protein FHQ21_05015 [Testudinibacter aquarius]
MRQRYDCRNRTCAVNERRNGSCRSAAGGKSRVSCG